MPANTIGKSEMDCLLAFADNPGWHSIVALPTDGPISDLIKRNLVVTRERDRFVRISDFGALVASNIRLDGNGNNGENHNGR